MGARGGEFLPEQLVRINLCLTPLRKTTHTLGEMRKLAILTISVLMLTGCSAEPEETVSPTPTATQTATPTPTEEPEPEPILVAAALTGVLYEEGTNPLLQLPAVSAKIDNTTPGRPQLALNSADIVYVTRVEIGLTRLLPVWHSRTPEVIGPVRSVRPVDAAIVDPFNGIFVYSGGQAPFKSAAKATGLIMSDEDTEMNNETYFREKSRVAPWNLFFEAAKLQELYSPEQPAPEPGFEFAAIPTAVTEGMPVLGLGVKYPQMHSEWELGTALFDWSVAEEPAWLRTQDGSEHTQEGGERVIAKNVVVMEVAHDLSFVDPKYGAIPKAMLENNEGIAHIFSDGYYLQAVWSKGEIGEPILLATTDGQPLKLAIGNTWVEMMDVPKSKLTITEPES